MLSKASVRKPYTVVVAVVLIIVLGYVAFTEMTTDLLPSINLPYAVVVTPYVGASPEEVEQSVSRPIEQAMATVNNISTVSSVSRENVSIVILEFVETADMNAASIDMRESLDQVSSQFTEEIGSSTIMKLNPDMLPVMVAAVDVEGMEINEISNYVDQKVIPSIESIEGVASIDTMGMLEEKINVIINKDKIDKVNDKIIASINDKMEDAKDEIDKAKEEIESGKEDLKTQLDEFNIGMITGQQGITEARNQILKADIELSSKESELAQKEAELKSGKAELQKKETELASAKKQLNSEETKAQEAELKKQLKEVTDGLLAMENGRVEAIATKVNLETKILETQNNPALSDFEKTAIVNGLNKTLETVKKTISDLNKQIETAQSGKTAIEDGLTKISDMRTLVTTGEKELPAAKKAIKDGEKAIEDAKPQLVAARKKLEASKKQLDAKEIELNKQKNEIGNQLEEATGQLNSGEKTLNEQTEGFDKQKEDAINQADINKMITADMIKNILTAQNFQMPAGYITEEGIDYLVRVGDKFKSQEEISSLVLFDLGMEGIEPITLNDVADVFLVDNSDKVYAKVNGNNAVILSIQKQNNYATAEVSKRIQARFDSLKENNDKLGATYLMDQGLYIDMVVDSVLDNLLMGGILAIIILFLFLWDLKPTFIITCSIPISVMFAIVLMYFSGVTLNVISLSGLAVGVGMLVDNSVVVIENIYRLRKKGYSAVKAAVSGSIQVAGAITASTLTTVCVFLPIVFVQGITRQLFTDMALTIAYSLGASLIIALTLVPMMSAGLLKKTIDKDYKRFDRFCEFYARILTRALRYKAVVLIASIAILILSVFGALSQGTGFMPEMDSPQINVTMEMPNDALFEDTKAMADEVQSRIVKIEDVDKVGAMTGGSGIMAMFNNSSSGAGESKNVQFYVVLKEDKKMSSKEVATLIEESCSDLEAEVTASGSSMDMSALGGSGIAINVTGSDLDTLKKVATEVADIVTGVEGTTEVSNGISNPAPELRIVVNKEKAMLKGLTVAQAYMQVQSAMAAEKQATSLSKVDGTSYPVVLVTEGSEELSLDMIRNFTFEITNKEGKKEDVKVSDIAEVIETTGFSSISREGQQRYLTVSAKLKDGYNIGLVSQNVESALEDYEAPAGYELVYGGENETITESMSQLVKMILLGILFIYLIMVAQFQSLLSPFIVLFTIPLAFTGGFLALFLTGFELSVIAMIGFVMLAGIVVNNGIVLVDYINLLRLDGMGKKEAIIEAGKTRMRPILMTALTTILGLSTMAMGMGNGADMVQSIAIVTIGGLTYATFMTLFVVPVMYDILNRRKMKKVSDEELKVVED